MPPVACVSTPSGPHDRFPLPKAVKICWSRWQGSRKERRMADGSRRSVDWHANLIVPETAEAEAAPGGPVLAATPLRIVLSEATDLWGVQPSGWLGASLFFAVIAAGGALL